MPDAAYRRPKALLHSRKSQNQVAQCRENTHTCSIPHVTVAIIFSLSGCILKAAQNYAMAFGRLLAVCDRNSRPVKSVHTTEEMPEVVMGVAWGLGTVQELQ